MQSSVYYSMEDISSYFKPTLTHEESSKILKPPIDILELSKVEKKHEEKCDHQDSSFKYPHSNIPMRGVAYSTMNDVDFGVTPNSSFLIKLKFLGFFYYWLPFIGNIFFILMEKKQLFVLFNAWQALCIQVFFGICFLITLWNSVLLYTILIIYIAIAIGMSCRIYKDAPTFHIYKLDIIGEWSERRALIRLQHFMENFFPRV